MTGSRLPDGVPADNSAKSFSDDDRQNYAAPDMATPKFTRPGGAPAEEARPQAAFNANTFEDADDDQIRMLPGSINPVMMFVVLALVIGLIGALAFMNSRPGLPLCSTQPEWNQYDCRAG